MCTVAQCNQALRDSWMMILLNSSFRFLSNGVNTSLQLHIVLNLVISLEPLLGKWLGNGMKILKSLYQVRTKLGHSIMHILLNWRTFIGMIWYMYLGIHFVGGEKYLTGTESVKNAAKSSRPVTVTGKAKFSKVKNIIKSHGRYTIRNMPKLLEYSYRGCISF